MYLTSPEFGLLIHNLTPTISVTALALVIALTLLIFKRKRDVLIYITALALTVITVSLLKMFFQIPRPEEALVVLTSYAFPSGHAATGGFIAVMFSWLILKNIHGRILQLILVCISIGISFVLGYSRILIDVHTPLQVIAGFALGAVITAGVLFLSSKNYFSVFGK